jgi:hypothetical protein
VSRSATANGNALGGQQLIAATDDQLGGATADVHHQPWALRPWQCVGDTGIDKLRFFMAGDDVDGITQVALGAGEEQRRVPGFAHRAGGHRPYATGFEATQFFAESGQRLPAAVQRQFIERPALKALRQTHRFTQGFYFLDNHLLVAAYRLANHEAKRVGAQVDGGKQGGVFHGGSLHNHLAAGWRPPGSQDGLRGCCHWLDDN